MNSSILKPGFAETLSDHNLGQLFENNSFDSLVKTSQSTSKFINEQVLLPCLLLQTKFLFFFLLSPQGRFLTEKRFENQDFTPDPELESASEPGDIWPLALCRVLQKWLPGNRGFWVLVHLLLFIPSVLQTQHKIFHFLPVLALCPISRALGDWLRPPACTECHIKVSMSKPDGHLVQPLVSKQPVWLGSWYSMFYTLSLSIQTPGSAQHWESDSRRHCCWFERKEQRQPCEICFFVFCLCAFQKGKSLLFSGSTRLMTAAVLHYSTGSTQLDSYVQFGVHISIRLS